MVDELLGIEIQEYVNERHSLEEMNELYEKFASEIERLKAKGDALSAEEKTALSVLGLKAFQLVRVIDKIEG